MDPGMYKRIARHRQFTLNNYTQEEVDKLKTFELGFINYICFGFEIAPTTGTPHLQGYIQNDKPKSGKQIQDITGVQRLIFTYSDKKNEARGDANNYRNYCKKKTTEFIERGEIRNAKEEEKTEKKQKFNYQELIESGLTLQEISKLTLLSSDKLLRYFSTFEKERINPMPIEVYWYFGVSNVGKSRLVRELEPNLFCYAPVKIEENWEGYDKHEAVLFDDFRNNWFRCERLHQLLDIYPTKLRVLYGNRQALYKRIYFTCDKSPEDEFAHLDRNQRYQIIRRLTKIILIRKNGQQIEVDPTDYLDDEERDELDKKNYEKVLKMKLKKIDSKGKSRQL